MAESFKYKRLEVSKLLFQSWGEYKILLGRKNYESSTYSFMFYPFPTISQFHKMEKGRRKNYLLLKEYKAGYCSFSNAITVAPCIESPRHILGGDSLSIVMIYFCLNIFSPANFLKLIKIDRYKRD